MPKKPSWNWIVTSLPLFEWAERQRSKSPPDRICAYHVDAQLRVSVVRVNSRHRR